jgi:6-phosphogluconolactonase (cycloisomerase 2 family)
LDVRKVFCFALLLGSLGCGAGTSSTPPIPSGKPEFLYALSSGQIQSLRVNPTTGAVSQLPGVGVGSTPGPANPGTIVADPLGRFIYVSDVEAGRIEVFTIDQASGQLTRVANSPFPTLGQQPYGMAADSTGNFLFVANSNSDTISAFTVGSSGALTPVAGSPFPVFASPFRLALDSTNTLLLASDNNSPQVSSFTVNSVGAVSRVGGSPFRALGVANWLTVNPSSQFLFASSSDALTTGGAVEVFAIGATGSLSQVLPSLFPAGRNPQDLVLTADGAFLYVANQQDDTISAFSVGAGGSLVQISGSPFPGGSSPRALTIDSAGKFLYIANSSSAKISVWSINSTTGLLTTVSGSPFGITAAAQDLVLVLIQQASASAKPISLSAQQTSWLSPYSWTTPALDGSGKVREPPTSSSAMIHRL